MRLLAVLLLTMLPAVSARAGSYPAAEGFRAEESDLRAIEIADQVMEAMGGYEAWASTRYVSWLFFGRRQHYWDRFEGDVRIESDDTVLLMNLDTRQGRAFVAGEEIVDPARRQQLLEEAYAWWVNDSYWVFMPYKLKDGGVRLKYLGPQAMQDGGSAEAIELTFANVGLTPQNKYVVRVDAQTHLVGEWSYYETIEQAEPQFTLPWNDWQKVGRILLAGNHGRDADWKLVAYDQLPRAVFEDPAPVNLE